MSTILTVFSSYSAQPDDPDLGDSLVRELRNAGHEVTVLAYGRGHPDSDASDDTFLVRTRTTIPVLKYLLAWPQLSLAVLKIRRRYARHHFKHLLVQAPLAVKLPVVLLFLLFGFRRRTAIVFDLFPRHQVEIGALPRFLLRPLHFIESWLMRKFSEITAMGDRNRRLIRDYYLRGSGDHEVRIVPPWNAMAGQGRSRLDRPDGWHSNVVRVVFGGQIIPGRRVDRLIDFLQLIRDRGIEVGLWIYSSGPGFERLCSQYGHVDWITFFPRVSRQEYCELLSGFDIGAVVTDDRVSSPALPSKIVDYSQAGLASLCLVEGASELYSLAAWEECIHLNGFDFTPAAIERACAFIEYALTEEAALEAGRFADQFSVDRAAAEILR